MFYGGWSRGLTLVGALSLMLAITLLPRALAASDGQPIGHGVLTLLMWGLSAAFVHGVGFVPGQRLLRVALGPIVAWSGLALGASFYVRYALM